MGMEMEICRWDTGPRFTRYPPASAAAAGGIRAVPYSRSTLSGPLHPPRLLFPPFAGYTAFQGLDPPARRRYIAAWRRFGRGTSCDGGIRTAGQRWWELYHNGAGREAGAGWIHAFMLVSASAASELRYTQRIVLPHSPPRSCWSVDVGFNSPGASEPRAAGGSKACMYCLHLRALRPAWRSMCTGRGRRMMEPQYIGEAVWLDCEQRRETSERVRRAIVGRRRLRAADGDVARGVCREQVHVEVTKARGCRTSAPAGDRRGSWCSAKILVLNVRDDKAGNGSGLMQKDAAQGVWNVSAATGVKEEEGRVEIVEWRLTLPAVAALRRCLLWHRWITATGEDSVHVVHAQLGICFSGELMARVDGRVEEARSRDCQIRTHNAEAASIQHSSRATRKEYGRDENLGELTCDN
ncbi:hypothetical protein B0H19DRAFT_1062936 [Mycena capillaripes]|nr:hypothetical protein B0H19DRAFT_1062936 [Mycena capillaripes]